MAFLTKVLLELGSVGISIVFAVVWAVIVWKVARRSLMAALLSGLIGAVVSYGVQRVLGSVFHFGIVWGAVYSGAAFIVGGLLGLRFPIIRSLGR